LNGTKQTSSGKLSFGTDNEIPEYYSSGLTVGTTYVLSAGDGTETGTLANNVPAHSYSYVANAFADTGIISVNSVYSGVTLTHTVDLDTIPTTAFSQTVNGITISLSDVKDCEFLDTTPFPQFTYRTGSWSVGYNNFSKGINYVRVDYGLSNIGDDSFAVDTINTDTVISANTLDTLSMGGSKYISGVHYYTSGTAKYSCIISNAYINTYQNGGNISFTDTNCTISATSVPNITGLNSNLDTIEIVDRTATINATRLLNQGIGVSVSSVDRPLSKDDTPTNSMQYINNILLDNVSESSNNNVEYFNGENYRLKDVTYTNTADITNTINKWDSEDNLTGVTGLQVYGDNLVYPSIDFGTIVNGPVGNPNYVGITGEQIYIRKYYLGLGVSNLKLVISGSGSGSFKSTNDSSSNYIHVEAKSGVSPGPALTSWLDCYRTVADGGCYASAYGGSRAFNGTWGLTFGTDGTAYSSGYVILRITTNATITSSQISLNSF
jgi:hypothetical protein